MPGITSIVEEAARAAQQNAGKWFRVTLKRGLIGIDWRTKRCAQALGLRRVGQRVYRKVTPMVLGNIFRIKELVHITITHGLPPAGAMHKTYPAGFTVIGSLLNKHI